MSWKDSVLKNKKASSATVDEGARVKTAGIYTAQKNFRANVLAEAAKVPRFAGENSKGEIQTGSEGSMFNSRGEMNAWDKRDAINQSAYAATQMGKVRAAAMKKAVELSNEERQALLSLAYSDNPSDRLKFAQNSISLVYDRLDYIGFTPDILQEIELGMGVIPAVEHDINVPAVIVAEDAKTLKTAIVGNRTFFEEFELTSLPTVSIKEVNQRSFNIIDRIFEKVPRQIALKEDRTLVRALRKASTIKNTNKTIVGGMTVNLIEDMAVEIERHRLECDKFLFNRKDYSQLRKSLVKSSDFDPITSRDMFVSGYMGKIFDYNLYVLAGVDEDGLENEVIPEGHAFAVAGPRYVGYLGVRVPLDVYNADQMITGDARFGWFYYKSEGMAITNPRSVVYAKSAGAVTPLWMY
jgi:hypothetical protein